MVVRYRETPTDPWSILNPGPRGKSAYEVAVDDGFTGTEQEWLDSLKNQEPVVKILQAGETRPTDFSPNNFLLRTEGDYTNLVTNPSARNTSGTVTVRENLMTSPIPDSVANQGNWLAIRTNLSTFAGYIRATITDNLAATIAQRIEIVSAGYIPVTAGSAYSISADLRSSAGFPMVVAIQVYDDALNILGSTQVNVGQVTDSDDWLRIGASNFTVPAGATKMKALVGIAGSAPRSVGDWFDVRHVMVEKSPVIGDYFDGSTPAAGDFTYAWSGAVNASTSKQLAPKPDLWSTAAADAIVYYSQTKDRVALRAIRDLPAGGSFYASLGVSDLPLTTSNIQLTILTDFELAKPGGVTAYIVPSGGTLVNETEVVGTYRRTFVQTITTRTLVPINFKDGASAGDTIYFRSLLALGDYDGDYFDGSSGVARWNGLPDASTSTLNLPALSVWDGTEEHWAMNAPGGVLSVNGETGSITLDKTDVGLTNVDNTSDLSKPISTATQTALDLKAPLASPTFTGTVGGITKAMVGLSNVDNTTDLAKPISTATQTALNLKAPLASPTFTGTVAGITKAMVGLANVDNTSDLSKPVSTATQTALNLKANLASPTFTGTVGGITKAMVGLANVDNTSDVSKPVSTAQQTALNLKANIASPTFTGTVSGITAAMVGLGNVPNVNATLRANHTGTQTVSTISDFTTYVGAKVIVLGPTDPVPGGTAAGTVIIRTET